jgi:hypothetical protein
MQINEFASMIRNENCRVMRQFLFMIIESALHVLSIICIGSLYCLYHDKSCHITGSTEYTYYKCYRLHYKRE